MRRRRLPCLHPDVALLLATLSAVAALHGVKALAEPPLVAALDAPEHEGARVAVEARVLDLRHGARGRWMMLADDTARLPVLAPPGDGPARGDTVRAVGVVTRGDDGAPALSLERLEVLQPAATRPLTPAEVARAPHLHEGARMLVRGEWRDGQLAADGARLTLAGDAPPERDTGPWLAAGTFYYRERSASYVLAVDTWTRAG